MFTSIFRYMKQMEWQGKKIKDGRSWICYTDFEVFLSDFRIFQQMKNFHAVTWTPLNAR